MVHVSYIGQTYTCIEHRYNHISYITSNNPPPKWAYALHTLHSQHKYEPMNTTMSFLHPVHKTWQTSSLENSYIQFCQHCTTIINYSLRKLVAFSSSHLQHTTQSWMCMTHIHLSPIRCLILVEDTANLITSTLPMWSISYNCFTYVLQYIVLSTNTLITTHTHISFISGWWHTTC
jgi:hypothetical protein